jgi:pilus assembly protein Flp/PilA
MQISSAQLTFDSRQSGPFQLRNVNKSEQVTGPYTTRSHEEKGFAHVNRTISLQQAAPCANCLNLEHFDFCPSFLIWHGTCFIHMGVRPSFETQRRNTDMKELMLRLYREEAGQDLTEYALLLVLIALVAITTMKTLGTTISSVFANATANLTSAS